MYVRVSTCNISFELGLENIPALQVFNQLLLLLEDVLELAQGGLHLLQRELVLALLRLVLGHPGVELSDGVVQQNPLLYQHLALLHPGVGHGLDLVVPLLESGHLGIRLGVSGHLEGGSLSGNEDLHVVDTGLVEVGDLLVQSLDLVQGGRLGETLGGGLLSIGQPGRELLDASPVLGPELDVVGVLVALHLGLGLQVHHVVGDPGQLVLEDLSVGGNLVTLGEQIKLPGSVGLQDLQLGGDVLLEVHGPGNSVLGQHSTGGFLDVLQLSGGSILPGVQSLQGVVEVSQSSNKLLDLSDGSLESFENLEFLLNSLNLLGETLLLVFRDGDAHGVEVVVDGVKESTDSIVSLLVDVLSLLQISIGSLQVEDLLHLLDFLLSKLEISSDGLAVLSVTDEGILSLSEKSQPVGGLVLGVLPPILDSLDIGLEELGFVRVLED